MPFITRLSQSVFPVHTQGVLSIANLRDSPRFPYKAELDHAIGAAVKYLGPRHVLEAVPLNITGDE